ncbi:MAG: YbbR-like domain-containing protein [Lawsonibacter sp.]|jgi:YbbR domain-containing protein
MMQRLRESKWSYMLLSIVLALIFWLYVRTELDPADSTWLSNIPVEITGSTVLTRQNLTVAELSAETVSLRVNASTSVINQLVRNREDITVTLDVSKCVEGENKLNYTINYPLNVNQEGIVTTDRNPELIEVTVEKLYTNTFPVEFQLKGKVADGYQVGTPAINPETVVVSGSVEQVSQVAKVVAILEDEELDEQFSGDLPLRLFNSEGEELTDLDVTLDSESAYVVVPVVVLKEVPLTVEFIPGGGATEDDITYKFEPETITVAGSKEDIGDLTELSLGSVDLAKVIGSNTFTLPIDLNPSLENVSGITSATVTVTVEGLATRALDVDNISLINKPEGYTVTSATQSRTVFVRGKEEDLANINASQLRIVADVSEYTAVGTYSVMAKVYLDTSSTVGVIGDYSISVNVSR